MHFYASILFSVEPIVMETILYGPSFTGRIKENRVKEWKNKIKIKAIAAGNPSTVGPKTCSCPLQILGLDYRLRSPKTNHLVSSSMLHNFSFEILRKNVHKRLTGKTTAIIAKCDPKLRSINLVLRRLTLSQRRPGFYLSSLQVF